MSLQGVMMLIFPWKPHVPNRRLFFQMQTELRIILVFRNSASGADRYQYFIYFHRILLILLSLLNIVEYLLRVQF